MTTQDIIRKVEQQNRFNRAINQIAKELHLALDRYCGQKVVKIDGSLLAKIESDLSGIKTRVAEANGISPNSLQVWKIGSLYSIAFSVRDTSDFKHDISGTVYIFDIQGQTATRIYDWQESYYPQYDSAQVCVDMLETKHLKERLNKTKEKLGPFEKYVDSFAL